MIRPFCCAVEPLSCTSLTPPPYPRLRLVQTLILLGSVPVTAWLLDPILHCTVAQHPAVMLSCVSPLPHSPICPPPHTHTLQAGSVPVTARLLDPILHCAVPPPKSCCHNKPPSPSCAPAPPPHRPPPPHTHTPPQAGSVLVTARLLDAILRCTVPTPASPPAPAVIVPPPPPFTRTPPPLPCPPPPRNYRLAVCQSLPVCWTQSCAAQCPDHILKVEPCLTPPTPSVSPAPLPPLPHLSSPPNHRLAVCL
jgi:hypothetical protein